MIRRPAAPHVALAVLAVWFAGCDRPPQAELDSAAAALESARAAQAEVYAADEFAALQDSFDVARAAIDRQSDRPLPTFARARETLSWVADRAAVVRQLACDRKEEIRLGLASLLDSVAVSVDSLSDLVVLAPQAKESEREIELYRTDVVELRALLHAARRHLQSERFPQAETTARSVSLEASSLERELRTAIDRYERLRRPEARRS